MEEAENRLIPINVVIAGRSYRIRIAPADEAFVRGAIKRANEQISELRRTYAGKDDQDFVAMCLLMYATDPHSGNAGAMLEDELKKLSAKIDEALNH